MIAEKIGGIAALTGGLVMLAEATPVGSVLPDGTGLITSLSSGGILAWLLIRHIPEMARQNKEAHDQIIQLAKDSYSENEATRTAAREQMNNLNSQIAIEREKHLDRVSAEIGELKPCPHGHAHKPSTDEPPTKTAV